MSSMPTTPDSAWQEITGPIPDPQGEGVIHPFQMNVLALQCPGCFNIVLKRRDSFLVGAHQATCSRCGFATDRVQTGDGSIQEKQHGAEPSDG